MTMIITIMLNVLCQVYFFDDLHVVDCFFFVPISFLVLCSLRLEN